MTIELQDIRDFLAAHRPFDQLPPHVLDGLPRQLEARYVRRDTVILQPGDTNSALYILRSGAVAVRDERGDLLQQLGEGDCFGARSLLRGGDVVDKTSAIEDSLLYQLPADAFHMLRSEHRQFAYYFEPMGGPRLREAMQLRGGMSNSDTGVITPPVRILMRSDPVSLPSSGSIADAARMMTDSGISSVLVIDDGVLRGIVTDRDIRSRCVAAGISRERPVQEIMTRDPHTIDRNSLGLDAMVTMLHHNIRHLPVVDGRRVVGVLTATDMNQRQSASPVYLVGNIGKQNSAEALAAIARRLEQVLLALVDADATAQSIGRIISAIGDAITRRLLQLAEEKFGAPPVPYVWFTAGSLARAEQTALSDQDNGVILSDAFVADQHGEYFERLSHWVCDGLNACGYMYCPGGVMASNQKWRQPLRVWKEYFSRWIDTPEPKALMHASIFFDLRAIYGEAQLLRELQQDTLPRTQNNAIFLAYMAANALQYRPPLGFFRHFVLVHDKQHDRTLDLKKNGIIPIVDLARVYALAGGVHGVNTVDRLERSAAASSLSKDGATDLLDALEFIGMVRLRHQADRIRRQQTPDNFVSPTEISRFDRDHLKDAFVIVQTMQEALDQRYQATRFL